MTLLDDLLRPGTLTARYQPIVAVADGSRTIAVEGLVRGPGGSNLEDAAVLFDYVRRRNEEAAVDRACVAAVIGSIPALQERMLLTINVHASTLARDASFCDHLAARAELAGVGLSRIVLEIVEHSATANAARFLTTVRRVRSLGVRLAIDDLGRGHSNFQMILDTNAEFLKIDSFFVQGASSDPRKRAVITSVAALAGELGAAVIAEGVERPDDLQVVADAGIELAQGFYFSRPLTPEQLSRYLHEGDLRGFSSPVSQHSTFTQSEM